MTFQDSIRVCLSKYADFNGTASRPEFWWFILFVFVVAVALTAIVPLLGNLFSLAMLLPQLAVGARRLHETGKSGWLQLLLLLPVVGLIVLIVFGCNRPGADGATHSQPPDRSSIREDLHERLDDDCRAGRYRA